MSAIPPHVRDAVLARDKYACLRCGKSWNWAGWSIHHRQGRRALKGLDPHRYSNLVLLCGSGSSHGGCHQHVHTHPEDSYRDGWMVRRIGDDDTTEIPLLTVAGVWIALDDTGDIFNALTGRTS